jgi:hypothetical protein
MIDFFVFIRGCYLTTNAFRKDGSITALPPQHLNIIAPDLEKMPRGNTRELQIGLEAFDKVWPLLRTSPEFEFYSGIRDVLSGLIESSRVGYTYFVSLYTTWMTDENFEALTNTRNGTMQLLLFFYLLESMILAPLAPWDFPEGASISEHRLLRMLEWSDKIWADLCDELRDYLRWPKSVFEKLSLSKENQFGESSLKDALRVNFLNTDNS